MEFVSKCKKCDSPNIYQRGWIAVNSDNALYHNWMAEPEEYWCDDCSNFVEIYEPPKS